MKLHGLSAFPITPMDGRGHADVPALVRLVGDLASARVQSIGLLGSTGSYAYLPRQTRAEVTALAVEAAGAVPVVVGIGAPGLGMVLDHARDAVEAGASALLLAPVSYQPLREEEVFTLYRIVAAEAGLPLVLYNNPGTTGVTFSPALIARIGALPGVVAVKMPPSADAATEIPALRAALPADVTLGYSGDAKFAGALAAGAEAWFSVLGGLFPKPCLDMLAAAGDAERLAALDVRLAPVWEVFGRLTSYRVIHAAAGLMGYGAPVPPLPVLPLQGEDLAAVEAALTEAGLLE
ncbi:dihydrodipicolinate synthase family protein [Frigidibacter albus]|uniref:Dihydrodipicolinate synthase family protein n=1 Tax=Frigidibacter albus TaxID=1465486 RepID=A0A6L8VD25_9RHOB|nr:dihydrodipicolinate synthase family protein [Frigidibacter albus]MZQ88114.1 dihydrodipicolinate synthase family protein [Frigidibacter albus]NBE30212.1 dihydrodipicolinate synthase family protein [Frigidibacter albus]GGH47401.1 dihydrodipicolinate synthase family protein [Frigidibacter albus]